MVQKIDYLQYLKKIQPLSIPFKGREEIIRTMRFVLRKPSMPNVLLLADAGSGKTTLVQHVATIDTERDYYELDIAGVISEYSMSKMIAHLKSMSSSGGREIVVFIDEFHRIADIDATSSEEMLQLLAQNGIFFKISFITATTSKWFYEKLQNNEPLVQRFTKIQLPELSDIETIEVLKSRVKQYERDYDVSIDEQLLKEIVANTSRYMPADAQPRKSIGMLDSLVGYYREFHEPISHKTLAKMFKDSIGVNIDFKINIEKTFDNIKSRVFGQDNALEAVKDWLYIAAAGLNDLHRPIASFLFVGPTGVGKTEFAKAIAEGMYGSEREMIRFDMSEYPLGDVNASNRFREKLSREVSAKPFSVLLLDELEKSDKAVVNLLLQVLDDARLSDEYGRTISFNNVIVIMTTNTGTEVFREIAKTVDAIDYDSTTDRAKKKKLRDISMRINGSLIANPIFETAVLGRVNSIVPFMPLKRGVLVDIIKNQLSVISDLVKRNTGKKLYIDHRFYVYFIVDVASRDTESGGVRDVLRIVNADMTAFIAQNIINFQNDLPNNFEIELGGSVRFMNDSSNEDKSEFLIKEVYSENEIRIASRNVEQSIKATLGMSIKIDIEEFLSDVSAYIRKEDVANLEELIVSLLLSDVENGIVKQKYKLAIAYDKRSDEVALENSLQIDDIEELIEKDLITWGRSDSKIVLESE
ncbi:AAA family ATPase [Lactococcus insecticola]|uniref:ATPase AAA n=1 Tax=Pseudolactococcus insecticola TaxID=2709158 RepID=A0A6A0B760_9LACT|nr:AAA family ATPase [Lactococcus insecticola]GFH41269.1 ATPase AAA [Lactococcus insecticola]